MPFEPLGTDELLSEAPKPKKDFEGQLMTGCGVILVSSVITYVLVFWPFAVFEHHTVSGLVQAVLFASVPVWVFAAFLARKFGQAGASGLVGGALCGGIFMFLRLQMVMAAKGERTLAQPEYPERWIYIVPGVWLVATIAVMLLFLPRWTDEDEGQGQTDRQSP